MDSNTTGLTHNVLHAEEAIRAVSSSAAGGVTTFLGTTRDNFDGKEVISLEYEAYQPMALKEMQKLCERARAKWPQLIGIAVLHRLGSVSVGEASVVVSVSAPHRQESIGKPWDLLPLTQQFSEFCPCFMPLCSHPVVS